MHNRIVHLLDHNFSDVVDRYFTDIRDRSQINFAYAIAQYAHTGQEPRQSGAAYITHPENVAKMLIACDVRSTDYLCLALLHDIFEDCGFLTRDDVVNIGRVLGSWLIDELHILSKRYKNPDIARSFILRYYQGLRHASRRVQIVKMFDRLDNLRDLESAYISHDKRVRIKATTRTHFISMAQDMLRGMNRTDEMRHVVEFLLESFERLCKG